MRDAKSIYAVKRHHLHHRSLVIKQGSSLVAGVRVGSGRNVHSKGKLRLSSALQRILCHHSGGTLNLQVRYLAFSLFQAICSHKVITPTVRKGTRSHPQTKD